MKYMTPFGTAKLVGYGLSIAVVVQSFVARKGFIELTHIIKFTSNSQRIRTIIICVFLIFFLNAGLMYLLAPMDMTLPIVSDLELGIYQDFNQYWYSNIGYLIINVLMINAIMPPCELVIFLAIKRVQQSWD